ncbi:ATP-binding mismatch repair protein, partial [Coemansia aciculifera]
ATFGFRGEALSSLCSVANVTVTTATRESAPMGMRLVYDAMGELVEQTAVARERGTTIELAALFARWPVRLAELRRNARREYARLVSVVEQYAVISDQARVVLSNHSGRGNPTVAVRTVPGADRLARVLAVFGAHMRPHLIAFGEGGVVSGFISKPVPEAGRGAGDRQFFFVNGRPCDFPRAKKLVNELYRARCPSRLPLFVIEVVVGEPGSVDVNLTPDKRTLLLRYEDEVLETLREVLVAQVLEPAESTFSANESGVKRIADVLDSGEPMVGVIEGSGGGGVKRVAEEVPLQTPAASKLRPRLEEPLIATESPPPPPPPKQRASAPASKAPASKAPAPVAAAAAAAPPRPKPTTSPTVLSAASKKMNTVVIGSCRNRMQNDTHDWKGVAARLQAKQARLKAKLEDSQQRDLAPVVDDNTEEAVVREGGGLKVTDSSEASSALSRLIHKSDFRRMQVVGQFNRGFIIARLDADLYIIDQHASDEKFNFEMLQQKAQIASQPLIQAATLQLGVTDEAVAIEFRDRLMQNGFHIAVDDDAEPGQRLKLLSQPFIDQTLFDQRDLMELVAKLSVNPESMPRCERARKMFASRACRKSTMIGDPLGMPQIRAIVDHLSDLDHPWN